MGACMCGYTVGVGFAVFEVLGVLCSAILLGFSLSVKLYASCYEFR
jgi:hypothetical protein